MNMKRMRSRYYRSGGGNNNNSRHHNGQVPLNRNHVFDSNGPDGRVRGTAHQLFEKYLQLGRDAASSGDRVAAEGFFQHAEHYFRILNAMTQLSQQAGNGQQKNARPASRPSSASSEDAEPGPGDETEASDEPKDEAPASAEEPEAASEDEVQATEASGAEASTRARGRPRAARAPRAPRRVAREGGSDPAEEGQDS